MKQKSSDSLYSRNFSIKQHWTQFELKEKWTLNSDELELTQNKSPKFQLGFALKLRFFDQHLFFPNSEIGIPTNITEYLAQQLDLDPLDISQYNWLSRNGQIHDSEIRDYFGYRKISEQDRITIKQLIDNELFQKGLPNTEIQYAICRFLKESKIEITKSIFSFIDKSITEIETKFFKHFTKHIDTNHLQSLFLSHQEDQAILTFIKQSVGKISKNTITEEITKFEYLEHSLYDLQPFNTPQKLIKKYAERVMITTPKALQSMENKAKIYTLLSCFCIYKGGKIIDYLIEIFIKRFSKLEKIAESKAKEDLWNHYKTGDSDQLLKDLVNISLDHPDGIIKEKIYEGVGGKSVLEQCKSIKKSSRYICKALEYQYLRDLYIKHHKKYLLEILTKLCMNAGANSHNLLVTTKNIINGKPFSYKSLLTKMECAVVEGNNIYQELAVLRHFKKALKCRNIWIRGSLKYGDPDKDLPQDFKKNKQSYCQIIRLSETPDSEIVTLKTSMLNAIKTFNSNISNNTDIRIGIKRSKPHMYVTPYEAQEEPVHVKDLKNELLKLWPTVSLIDIFKESDFRVGLTNEIITMAGKVIFDEEILQQRLLTCLFAMGTNTEFKKICIGIENLSESDLSYIKKRFVTPNGLRHIIRKLINATLSIREQNIWGNNTNSFASDSTKFAAWSDNLMSEYHIRYKGYGIMAYWHVEKKALCISSQMKRCSSSEIASMLEGIIHHATNAKVEKHSTDTHGQSLIAFAFSYLLGIELRPRIKGVGKLKLYKPDNNTPKNAYNNIESIMERSINWKLIRDNYDEILKYLVALKLKTAEIDVLLKRFIAENHKNSVYQACLELGRAVRTIYLCKYFDSKEMRVEIEEALNVVENWNSGNNFIFFGRRGVISSNDEIDQELSILSLHLLQSSLVYINTLMLQKILKTKAWKNKLTVEDKRALTPLFYHHINQYGIYKLDMNSRIKIEEL